MGFWVARRWATRLGMRLSDASDWPGFVDIGVFRIQACVRPFSPLCWSFLMSARRPTKPVRPDLQPGRLLLSQAQIHARVRQLGRTITRHYAGQAPLFL